MPRNTAHRAQRELERTVRRLRAFCATEHVCTIPESLWAAVEKNKSGAVFFFDFARLLRLNRKTRHSLRRLSLYDNKPKTKTILPKLTDVLQTNPSPQVISMKLFFVARGIW